MFKDVHEPIIDRAIFETIQLRRGKTRKRPMANGERNMFSGLLVCSDCGRNLHYHFNNSKLDYDAVTEIMNELKPNQVEKLKIPMDDIRKYVPKSMTPAEMQAYLLKLVKQDYERQHNRDAR